MELIKLCSLSTQPNRSLFPETYRFVAGSIFFEYTLLNRPLQPDEAKKYATEIVTSVCDVLEELHSFGIAHLDVRLPNICVDTHPCHPPEAKLIDLDRSMEVSQTFQVSGLAKKYKGSVMYEANPSWTLDQVDWRQMGLMVFRFLKECYAECYNTRQPEPKSRFLCHLLDHGKLTRELLCGLDPTQDTATT